MKLKTSMFNPKKQFRRISLKEFCLYMKALKPNQIKEAESNVDYRTTRIEFGDFVLVSHKNEPTKLSWRNQDITNLYLKELGTIKGLIQVKIKHIRKLRGK